jgi:Double-GTPase 2
MANRKTRRRCPYCSEEIELGQCPIVATNIEGLGGLGGIELGEVSLPSRTVPLRTLEKTGWPVLAEPPNEEAARQGRSREHSLIGRALGGDAGAMERLDGGGRLPREDVPARACPACEHPLPLSIDSRETAVVAVVGVNRVGKTYLLATSLLDAMRRGGLDRRLGCTEFVADNRTDANFLANYVTPLRSGVVLEKTQAEGREERAEPLVFNVSLPDCEPFSLAVHDVAGEVLGDHKRRAQSATYLHGARGIVFVVDPRDIDDLRAAIPPALIENEEELGWDQGTLLSVCLSDDGLLADAPSVPVVIAIAKADLIPHATGESHGFLQPAPKDETPEAFYARIRTNSREVEDFLERFGALHILRPAREYRRRLESEGSSASITFQAFSALGKPPGLLKSPGSEAQPLNCVDPLATILAHV